MIWSCDSFPRELFMLLPLLKNNLYVCFKWPVFSSQPIIINKRANRLWCKTWKIKFKKNLHFLWAIAFDVWTKFEISKNENLCDLKWCLLFPFQWERKEFTDYGEKGTKQKFLKNLHFVGYSLLVLEWKLTFLKANCLCFKWTSLLLTQWERWANQSW